MLLRAMEYWDFLLYKRLASCAGRANIKNGAIPVKEPRRRDIAPTGELAGLPARDAPKTSGVGPRSRAGGACETSRYLLKNSIGHKLLVNLLS
jgi:hypothetical protein